MYFILELLKLSKVKNKFWVKMKISLVLLFAALLQIYAIDTYSQDKKLTVKETGIELRQLFKTIEKQSEFLFFFVDSDIDGIEVDINVNSASIETVLNQALSKTKLKYEISNRNIMIFNDSDAQVHREKAKAQQGIRINGAVSDNFGELLPGVSVVVRGSATGTSTDGNGEFTITVPSDTSVLQFRFIGYRMQEVVVGSRRMIAVTLLEETTELSEVTIVAFGTQKKESVVSSIQTVNTKDLHVPSSNLTTAFAGKMAGVIAYQTSGEPGYDNAEFFIRGITTFGTGKVDPLILVDNVELTTNDLARLHPDDIKSFSILKDATATALYGARGANGVVLVTTK